jgi:hypothetical protein
VVFKPVIKENLRHEFGIKKNVYICTGVCG